MLNLFVCLDIVSGFEVLELFKRETAFTAFSDFVNFVLETSHGIHVTCMSELRKSDVPSNMILPFRVTRHFSLIDKAPS